MAGVVVCVRPTDYLSKDIIWPLKASGTRQCGEALAFDDTYYFIRVPLFAIGVRQT